ncbi:MAG: hypothetical protein IJ783_00405 [Kiritimatiellae bacterium]|nr:hypothetical protein [Kiritimatiellia bacterium]
MGYTKLEVTTGKNQIVGAQFSSVGTNVLDIQDLVLSGAEDGDTILFFNGSTYDGFTYALETYDEDGEEDFGPGWTDDETGNRAVKNILPGESFWLKSSAEEIMLGGQANTNAVFEATCDGAFSLVSAPVPVEKDIQTIKFDGVDDGDTILFFNGSTYDGFTYALETYDEDGEEDFGPGWTDDETGNRAVKNIEFANGFWLKSESATVVISAE